MVKTTDQNLYVMQNEFGFIKIGRSVDVERRRLTLQTTERCKISVVEEFAGCGDLEEDLHIEMADFHVAGEWFDGSDEARDALSGFIGADDPPIEWPYKNDQDMAVAWLQHIEVVRHAAAIRKALDREIGILRSADGPSFVHDCSIFAVKFRADTGRRCWITCGKIESKWFDTDSGTNGIVPAFTASLENALLAWPESDRPQNWNGTAIDCCIAALTAIRARLPRVERIKVGVERSNSSENAQ